MRGAIDKATGFDHKLGPVPDPQSDPPPSRPQSRSGRVRQLLQPRRLLHLSLREYVPLGANIALWAVILAAIGHADTARMIAANVILRAVQLLTRLSTAQSLKARRFAAKAVRRQAKRMALTAQLAVLGANVVILTALIRGLDSIGQQEIAQYLPFIAAGMPARVLRYSDLRTDSPYFRLAMSAGGLVLALAGWAAGLGAIGMALAFGMREWLAYVVIRLWPKAPRDTGPVLAEPLQFAEIARNSAVNGRRLLTYRLTKIALTLFGPLGNFAARTGRGLNWHSRIEPHLPHRLSGFVLFALGACAGAVTLAWRSGEPAAMVAAAGLMQLAAAATNIAMMWHYLPDRDDPTLAVDDDDED